MFNYNKKETYSQSELEEILKQHRGFVSSEFKGFVSPEDFKKVKDELKPFKQEKRNTHIGTLVKDLTDAEKISDAIYLSNISDEDTDDEIIAKVTKTIESRKHLQKTIVDDKESIIKKPTPEVEAKSKKEYRFMKGNK